MLFSFLVCRGHLQPHPHCILLCSAGICWGESSREVRSRKLGPPRAAFAALPTRIWLLTFPLKVFLGHCFA